MLIASNLITYPADVGVGVVQRVFGARSAHGSGGYGRTGHWCRAM